MEFWEFQSMFCNMVMRILNILIRLLHRVIIRCSCCFYIGSYYVPKKVKEKNWAFILSLNNWISVFFMVGSNKECLSKLWRILRIKNLLCLDTWWDVSVTKIHLATCIMAWIWFKILNAESRDMNSANCPLASPLISLQVHVNTHTITQSQ